ncbi:Cyclic-di-AMP phosphodiesterase GdpP [Granulicatella adiacens]|uniref:DHH family phosphoesterase n=1 Tax=Granulicatella adiacens TaxID=46124 RepID=UPI00195E0476|nr:DHH family phosphoesterase [Granulicatella adiacens]VTX51224.1 Cyclic-di-AMP phosphodiesterase GdpP [Granulicatella adiacens]
MKKSLTERIKALPTFLKGDAIKKYGYSFIGIILSMLIIAYVMNIWVGIVLTLFVILIGILLYFFANYIVKETNHYVSNLSYKINKGSQDASIKMPIGMLLLDSDGEIQWINPYLQKYFDKKDLLGFSLKQVDKELAQTVSQLKPNEEKVIYWKEKYFQTVFHSDIGMLYMMDITEYAVIKETYLDERPVFGQIFVDNFAEVSQSLTDRKKSNLNNFVTNQLTSWANHNNIYLKRVDTDRFVAFLDKKILSRLEKDRFDIIDKIRETTAQQNTPLTVSMGFSYADSTENVMNYDEIASHAQENLDLALGRGGDQVVVRSKNEETRFYGGKSNPLEKRTRVRSRMVSQALENMMASATQIIIMGHQYPDMDCVGGCLGIRRIAKMHGKTSWIVTNPDQYSHDIKKLMAVIKEDEELSSSIVTPEMAEALLTPETLVIIVDVSKPSLTASPVIVEKANQLVIIDHHRRGQEFPANPDLVYIEPYASSAGELITELLEYQSNEEEQIKTIEATTLLAGIIVDTRNFTLRTGSRTFDTASYLKSVGADTILIQRLLKENVDTYLMRSHLLNSLEILPNNIGIVHGEETFVYPTVVAAQTADMMLSMENIDASFVVTRRNDGRVGISARSLGNKNVQRVMEKMGGGGHLSNAATQLTDMSIEEAIEQLKIVIQELDTEINL